MAEQWLQKVKALSATHTTLPESRLGIHRKLGWDTGGTAEHNWPKGGYIPYNVILHNKSWGRRRKWGYVQSDGIFPSNCYAGWKPAYLDMPLDACLPMGSCQWVLHFALCVQIFLYLLNCLHLNLQVFLLSPFWFSNAFCWGWGVVSKWLCST